MKEITRGRTGSGARKNRCTRSCDAPIKPIVAAEMAEEELLRRGVPVTGWHVSYPDNTPESEISINTEEHTLYLIPLVKYHWGHYEWDVYSSEYKDFMQCM
jgi:hypothetical protein